MGVKFNPLTGNFDLVGGVSQTDLDTALDAKQDADTILTQLSAHSGGGILVYNGVSAFVARAIDGTENQVIVTEAGGLDGNPTLSLPQDIHPGASPTFDALTLELALTLNSTIADTVPYIDNQKIMTSSTVTPTELGYLSGVTSAIQTQLDGKAHLAGTAGGQELKGGTANANDLDLNANSQSWSSTNKTGTVNIKNSLMRFEGQNAVSDTEFRALMTYDETITATGAGGFFNGSISGFNYNPLINHADSLNFGEFPAFVAKPRWQPTAAVADGSFFPVSGFTSGIRHQLAHSAGAGSTTKIIDFVAAPQFARASGTGTHTITNYAAFASYEGILFDNHIKTGYTVTTSRGFWARSPGVSGGTLTNNVGVDIELMASGTTNIGLRNAGTTVHTPVTQNITAATQAITVTSSIKMLTANNNYTLTAAPTIADGQNGQVVTIMNVDTADTITIQDQGTLANSNLRLETTTVALAPRQSIQLTYSSTVGDWVQTGKLITVI